MIASAVHHVSFPVSDIDRSRKFYGELLGFEEIPRPDFPFPGAWYRLGASEVHLIVPPPGVDVGTRPGKPHPMAGHVALAVDDYQKTVDFMKAHRVEVLETNPKVGQMWITDPDGNLIELIAPNADPGASFARR